MTKRQKHDAFRLAFDKFEAAHKSVLDLDRKKLMAAKVAGEALSQMRLAKGCTVEQLIATLDGLGITISQDTLNRYVKVASRWDEIVAIAKQRQIDLMALGYVEALGLLPLSEHAQKVKAGKQRPKVATTMEEPGSAPQKPPADWTGRVISFNGKQPASAAPASISAEPDKNDARCDNASEPVLHAFKLVAGKPLMIDATTMTLEAEEGLIKINAPDGQNILPLLQVTSRGAGRDDAVGRLQAVVDALDPDEGDGEVKELVDELENAISEAEGVDFPGMY